MVVLGTELQVRHDNGNLGARQHKDHKHKEQKPKQVVVLVVPDGLAPQNQKERKKERKRKKKKKRDVPAQGRSNMLSLLLGHNANTRWANRAPIQAVAHFCHHSHGSTLCFLAGWDLKQRVVLSTTRGGASSVWQVDEKCASCHPDT